MEAASGQLVRRDRRRGRLSFPEAKINITKGGRDVWPRGGGCDGPKHMNVRVRPSWVRRGAGGASGRDINSTLNMARVGISLTLI